MLVDVGVSGGISSHWRIFEPKFRAYGFDPLVSECERLTRQERNANVVYHSAYISSGVNEAQMDAQSSQASARVWTNEAFARTSAVRAMRVASMNFAQLHNAGAEIVLADRRYSLDEFFRSRPGESVDFLKVDTDGHDFEVLRGAKSMLTAHPVLGVLVEGLFHGEINANANVFANIDSFLRNEGFSLFDLEPYRYTRAALPGHFIMPMPGPTREGQIVWADVLYLRDVAAPGYVKQWNITLSTEKIVKLACLFELFGMPDCAAEVLITEQERLGDRHYLADALNILASEMDSRFTTLSALSEKFDSEPEYFYPGGGRGLLRRFLPRSIRGMMSKGRRRLAEFLMRT